MQVWDAAHIRDVLKSKGMVVYLDGRQGELRDAAEAVAHKLGTTVCDHPPVQDYPVDWDLPAEVVKTNDTIRQDGSLATRSGRYGLQWTGAMTPATVWNRPAIIFGNALNNRLIADLDGTTMLMRPARPEFIGAGCAIIEPVAAPFWNNADAIIILCADRAGMQAACATLEQLAAGQPLPETFSSSDDGGARAERRCLLGLEAPVYPKTLARLATATSSSSVSLAPVLPVNNLALAGDGVLATLRTPGHNLLRLTTGGKPVGQAVTAPFSVPETLYANAAGQAIVSDGLFLWYHDREGTVRWKMLGTAIRAPEVDGSVWVLVENTLKHISAGGEVLAALPLKETFLGLSADAKVLYLQRKGTESQLKSAAQLVAVDSATGQDRWAVHNLQVAEMRLSPDGARLACIEQENLGTRDDLESDNPSRLAVLDARSGQVLLRRPFGFALTNIHVSPDGRLVAVLQRGFSNILLLAEPATGVVRAVQLPESGIWSYTFTADSKALWVACDHLYRVNIDDLAVKATLACRGTALLARPDGGACVGTADGRLLCVSANGRLEHETALALLTAVDAAGPAFTALREAKLVDSPSVNPNAVGVSIPLGFEYTNGYGEELASPRGDGICPLEFAIRFPAKGRYRFTVELGNAHDKPEQIHPVQTSMDGDRWVRYTPGKAEKWQQTLELTVDAGTHSFRMFGVPGWEADGWSTQALFKTVLVEAVP